MSRIKVALFGLGRMGRNWQRVIVASPICELVAVVDPYVDAPGIRRSFADIARMDFEAAVVAAPTPAHLSLAATLLRAGKKVLVEKPMADTFSGCMDLAMMPESRDLVVGHVERFNPAIRTLREVLQDGLIGTPIHFSCTRVGGYPSHVTPSNNVTLDLAVHDIDLLRELLGELRIVGSVCHATVDRDVCDTAEILLSAGGASATVHTNWITPVKIRTFRVTGTAGVCFVDLIAQTCEVAVGSERRAMRVEQREPLAAELEAFAAFVRHGDRGELCSPKDASEAVHIAERALALSALRVPRAA